MAKSKNNKRTQGVDASVPPSKHQKSASGIITPPPDAATVSSTTTTCLSDIGLHADDILLAVDVLETLTSHPSIIKTKACKSLRTAVYQFGQACTTGSQAAVDTNLTSRISGALADGAYTEARILLAEMKIRGQKPKLGALCRWVRDLDVVSGLAEQLDAECHRVRTAEEEEALRVLDAILRLTGPTDHSSVEEIVADTKGPIIPRAVWNLRDNTTPRRQVYDSVLNKSLLSSTNDTTSSFHIIETTPALQRKPPNLHPAILYTSLPNTIPLNPQPANTISHHIHPTVPNLHLIRSVLSPTECDSIIASAERIGFTPDAPLATSEGSSASSILAHNFYWLVDLDFSTKLWNRVRPFVPTHIDNKRVQGLNRRFRVYRYVPGAEYRAHIDGAWPPSGIDAVTNKYIYDASPPGAKQSSLFTFLIYLNDEFEAGETTFFLPSASEGSMNAYSVAPVQGSVAMFPHGETEGSLLHEGTGVRRNAGKQTAKYVIRTDVLYDVEASVV